MTLAPRVFEAVPVRDATAGAQGIARAEIEVGGIEQAGPSYELRAFLDNPGADARTQPTEANGYAGSIHVYGYGTVLPPDLAESTARPRLPMTRSLIATDAVRRAARAQSTASVTLVAVGYDGDGDGIDLGPLEVAILVQEGPA